MRVVNRRKQDAPSREARIWARDRIALATTGHRQGGIRVDLSVLDPGEQAELVELVREAGTAVTDVGSSRADVDVGGENPLLRIVNSARPGINPAQLGGRLGRFEALVEKAAGKKPGEIFQAARDLEELRALGAEMKREKQAPPRRAKLAQPGSVTLPREWIFDLVRDHYLWPTHVAIIVYLAATWENGTPPISFPHVAYDGETLTVDTRRSNGMMPDPDGSFVHEEQLMNHLAEHGFIDLSKTGRVWRIKRGPKYLAQFRRAA